MKVAVLANLKEDAPVSPDDPPGRWDDLDDPQTVRSILAALHAYGFHARYFPAGLNLVKDLKEYAPDICFNTGEGHFGASRESQIPALLDMLQIPYTGSGVMGMYVSHNKHQAKLLFRQNGLPTANFFVVTNPEHIPHVNLHYPLFVKPAHEGSSIGINGNAMVKNRNELEKQIQWVWQQVKSPILVEEYIQGREFTIGILGDEVLPIVEIISPTGFYANYQKESEHSGVYRVCPANLPARKTRELQEIARKAMEVLELHDLGRMDLRMDENGLPYILEVNPLPLMLPDPEQASFVYASLARGYSYADMIYHIMQSAFKRLGLMMSVPVPALR